MKRTIIIAGLVASLASAPAALAQDEGYGSVQGLPSGPTVAGANATNPASSSAPVAAAAAPVAAATSPVTVGDNELPFTGLDLAIIVAAGLVLLGLGVGLRRAGRAEA